MSVSTSSIDYDARSGIDTDADAIRERMSAIRHDIRSDVDGIVRNAHELADWRHYVRTFPWGSLATAIAAGYLVVPRRLEVVSPDADEMARLAKRDQIVVRTRPSTEAKPGLLTTAAHLVGTAVLRAAVGYATSKIGTSLGSQAAEEVSNS